MSEHVNFLNSIEDNKPVRCFLPVKTTEERLRLSCVLKKGDSPNFKLLFKAGTLPTEKLDTDTEVIINLDIGGKSVSLESNLVEIVNNQTLDMVARKTINHGQLREFFRVDCTVPIVIHSMVPEGFGRPEDNWSIPGTAVDLSGCGLRASFSEEPPDTELVRLELALPTKEPVIISTLASPVRISPLTKKLWDVAFRFDEISDEDQDTVIGYCLVAQRRLLRLKVHVKGG